MPLNRYLVRNEYGLADPDLYKVADKDDPEALLEGVAMAGLVGVLRQLGDLAEFAAEMFHDLHEEVMATAARGHALIARVQQLEAEFPSAENTLLSQTTHIPFLYNSGVDWHPSVRMDENLVTQGDMPRFVMDSYEECRGPPRLFLLDKFDVAGAGACLKRYTDPSSIKAVSTEFIIKKSEGQREKRIRKVKRRGPQWRNGDTPEVYPSSHAKLHQLLLEERIETGANDPERRVKLKKRPLDGFTREDRLKSYMQKFMDTYSSDTKAVHEISLDLVPVNFESYNDSCQSGLEIVEYDTVSPSQEPFYKDKVAYSSFNIPEVVKPSINELNEVTDGRTVGIPGANYGADADYLSLFNKDVTDEELAADTGSKSGGSVGEYNVDDIASEIDNYVDALATLESETETDSDYRTKRDQRYRNGMKKMIDSDGSEEKQHQNPFFDYHSRGNSTISDDGTLIKKDIDIFSSSDNVSSSAEDATAKSSAIVPVNPLADEEKSVTREAQENKIEENIASDVAESMGKNLPVKSEFTELPWISVNVGSALTKTEKERMEQTDRPMSVGISPVVEVADASFESSSGVSLGHSHVPEATASHSQPEYSRDGQSTLFNEIESSSASSPAKPNNDLRQPVEGTSDGLTVLQKSSVSVLNFSEPVYVPCEDSDSTQITEEKSEDQPCVSDVSRDHEQPQEHVNGAPYVCLPNQFEQPQEHVNGAPYVCLPNQFDLSEDALQCSGKETNIHMASMAADDSELVDPMISVVTDIAGIVEPRISIGTNSEDSFALLAEPLCFGNSEYTIQLKLDISENIVAHSDWTVHESTVNRTNMNGDDSSNLNLVVNLSQVDSQSDQVPEVLDAPVLLDGEAAEVGISDSTTIADVEGLSESVSVDKAESHLSLDAIRKHNDCIATYLDQPGPAPVSSSEPLQAEEDTISFDDSTQHLPERKNDLDLNHSVQVLDHAETKVASARHNCLKAENTETERSLSSVLDCTSTGYEKSLPIGEDPYQNSDGSQIQSLQGQSEVDLHNPMSCGRDDGVNSDSTACDTSSIVLRSADYLHETCLAEGSPEEAPLSSVECDQHLERTNSSQYHDIEDKEHVLDALADVHTKTQFTVDKTVEAQSVEITEESSNATSQPSEYVEQILPPEDSGNKMCINPISVPSLCAPLSQPLAADHKLHNTWPAMVPADCSSISSRPVEAEARLKIENPGQTLDASLVSPPPLFGTFPNPTHIIPEEMPPLPPLPPMQWRLGRNQQTSSLVFGGLMQNSLGTLQRSMQPETSDNAGLRSQNSLMAQHLNPFLSLSDEGTNFQHEAGYSGGDVGQPTDFMFPATNMSQEDFTIDRRQDDAQLFTRSQIDLPVPEFSFESLESGLNSEDDTSALFEKVTQKETTEAHEQFEHIFSPAEQETAAVDEQLEHNGEKEIATPSAQFDPPVAMQYGHQLSHGFVAPEAQGIWSTDEFGSRKPENVNGSLHKKVQRPRNPLIDAVVAVDKSKLRKVGEIVKPQDKPEAETREQHLPQLKKVGKRVKPQDKSEAETREQHLPQLRKVGERVKPQDTVKPEESSQNFPPLRKIGERVKPQDLPSAEDSVQNLPQLRKVENRIKPQDEPKVEDDKQSFLPLKGVGRKLKPQDGPHAENKDWLEQIRSQSFNLKPPATSRPNIQGRQTNLKVTAILEKANMIRQAMAGTDDDSDGWSDS